MSCESFAFSFTWLTFIGLPSVAYILKANTEGEKNVDNSLLKRPPQFTSATQLLTIKIIHTLTQM